jgi:hydrogenase nickel incorporation protein HypB
MMCTTCGCGQGETTIEGKPVGEHAHLHGHVHEHADGTVHSHPHDHDHEHRHTHDHPAGELTHEHPAGEHTHEHPVDEHVHWRQHADGAWHSHVHGGGSPHARAAVAGPSATLSAAHAPGMSEARRVQIERDILAKNDAYAAQNRLLFADRGIFALNLVSSPGSGKTTLLTRTIEALRGRVAVAVIEGDQQTSLDADRIRATGAAAVQVNTGKGCHLDAHMVGRALSTLSPADGSLLLIENVGNLVCPAAFDLGEAHKVVVLSVTEGDDKPLKYPDMFHAADLLLVNKIDLLPHVQFDVDAAIGYAHRMRPGLPALRISATTGEGFAEWIAWLEHGVAAARTARDQSVEALRYRVAQLEAELARRSGAGPTGPTGPIGPAGSAG